MYTLSPRQLKKTQISPMGYFNGILRQKDPSNNSEEVIQTYANRLQHATLLADRKSAVKGLKSFSKDHREIVVQHGLRALLVALEKDLGDSQAVKAVLETLLILFLRGEANSEDQTLGWISNQSRLQNGKYPSPLLVDDIEIDQFSMWIADEILLSESQIKTFLTVLQEHLGFQIRLYSLQLLEALVATRPVRAKESLINIPLAISTIVELLADPNDPIRNETILLLMALVNNNFNIQKLVAFENTFERVFEIIEEEGGIRGSILVQDCLTLLTNLLMYNASNQKLFLETECVPKLAHLIAEPIEEGYEEGLKDENGEPIPLPPIVWTEQRLQNMVVVLEICKSFVDPDNQHVHLNQEKLESSGIFYSVLRLIFSPVMENPIRRTALQVVGDIMADNPNLQLKFSQLDVPYIDPSLPAQVQRYDTAIPAPVALVNWAILTNSVHIFEIRLAAMHCLSCFFRNNSEAKLAFISDQTKARSNPLYYQELQKALQEVEHPEDNATEELSEAGTHATPLANVFSTLMDFNTDIKLNPYSAWFAANILVTIIKDCPDARKLAREIKDGDEDNGEEVLTLIQAVSGKLTANLETSDPRIAIGCLMLLSFWLYEDFEAVNDFLTDASIIKSILAFLSKNSSELSEIVHGLATIFVGIVYEFTTSQSPIPRAGLFEIVTKSLGADNYASNVKQFKENPVFKNFDASIETGFERDATGLPKLYFISEYIELVKENFYVIKRALFRGPEFEPRVKLSHEVLEELEGKNAENVKALQELKEEATKKEADLKKLIEDTQNEQNATSELLKKCQSELDETKASEAEITDKLDKLSKELTEVQAQKTKFASLSEQYTAKYHELLKSLAKDEEALKKATRSLSDVEEAKNKAEAGINKMSRELFQLSKQKAEAEAKIAAFEQDMAKVKADHEKSLQELQSQNAQLMKINEELRAKIHFLEENGEAHASSEEKAVNPAKLRELQNQLIEQEEENDNLLEKLRAAASVVLDLRLSNSKYQELIEELETELANTYDELTSYLQLLDEANKQKSKNTSEDLINLRGVLKRELDELRALCEPSTIEADKKTEIDTEASIEKANGDSAPELKDTELEPALEAASESNQLDSAPSTTDGEAVKIEKLEAEPVIEERELDLEAEEKALWNDVSSLLHLAKAKLQSQELALQEKEHQFQEILAAKEAEPIHEPMSSTTDKAEELRRAYSRIARLEGNIEALSVSATESLSSFNNTRSSLQSRVEELESVKTKLLDEIETLKQTHKEEITAKEEAFDELEGAYFDLELLMSNVEKNKEEVDIKYNQMKKEYIVKIGQLQDEVQDLKKSLADVIADRDAINSEFSLLEKLSNKLESDLKAKEALLQAIADKGADLAAKDAIVIDIKERLASTIAQLGEAAQKNRSLSKERSDFEKLYNETAEKLRVSAEKIQTLETEIEAKTEESIKSENDRKRLSALQVDKVQAAEISEKQRVEILALKDQISSMESLVKSSLEQLEDERRVNSERSVSATLVHTEQVSKLEESIAKSQKTHDSDLKLLEESAQNQAKQYKEEISLLQEECLALKKKLESAEVASLDDSSSNLAHREIESEDLKLQLAAKSELVAELVAKLAESCPKTELEAVSANLQSRAAEAEELRVCIGRLEDELKEKQGALLKGEEALKVAMEESSETVLSLQSEVASLQSQIETSTLNESKKEESENSDLDQLRGDLEETKNQLLSVVAESLSLREELEQCLESKSNEAKSLLMQIEDLKKEVSEKDERIESLQNELQEVTSKDAESQQVEASVDIVLEKEAEILQLKETEKMLLSEIDTLHEESQRAKSLDESLEKLRVDTEAEKQAQTEVRLRLEDSITETEQKLQDSEQKVLHLAAELETLKKQSEDKSMDSREAEIPELEDTIRAKDGKISEKDAEILQLKAQLEEVSSKLLQSSQFATIPAASAATDEDSDDLEKVLLLCEEQEKTILRLQSRLDALGLADVESEDLC